MNLSLTRNPVPSLNCLFGGDFELFLKVFVAIFVGIRSNIHVITLPYTDVHPSKTGGTNCKQNSASGTVFW